MIGNIVGIQAGRMAHGHTAAVQKCGVIGVIANTDTGNQFQGGHGLIKGRLKPMFAGRDQGLKALARPTGKIHRIGMVPNP